MSQLGLCPVPFEQFERLAPSGRPFLFHQSNLLVPDDREVCAHLRITQQKISLNKFEVFEDGRRVERSYSEMVGYPSVSNAAVNHLAVRLTRRMNRADPENDYEFDEHLKRNREILQRAQFGDYSDLTHLLSRSMVLAPGQVEEILDGPPSEMLDRLSRYLTSTNPMMV